MREINVENIYISIYESGSWDDSKGALRELDFELERLGVPKIIMLDETTHIDEIGKPPAASGWIDTLRGKKELRRIPYLSKLRNLYRKLLNTNGGSYAAACALDFAKPPHYYDTFALRDSDGEEPVTQTWHFFRSRASRQAVIENRPVPLSSC
jgi:hypothetical protein